MNDVDNLDALIGTTIEDAYCDPHDRSIWIRAGGRTTYISAVRSMSDEAFLSVRWEVLPE